MTNPLKQTTQTKGFTIVELLIVIVVIGILAAITVVAYTGITKQAGAASLKSDLKQASTQLELAKTQTGDYPADVSSIKKSDNTTLKYNLVDGDYCLTATDGSQGFHITGENKSPSDGVCTEEACFAFSSGAITDYYDNEGNVGSGAACTRDVNIPSTIGGVAVTSIQQAAFIGNQLTSIAIPSSVTSVGDYAFSNNQLTSIAIPSSVTSVGDHAFSSNQLTSVVIPSSVAAIGESSFRSNQLTSVTIPSSVAAIGERAFQDNQLTSVTIPSSVTTIGFCAFYSNQLTSVTIPSSVTTIDDCAFYNNQLTSVTISSLATVGANSFDSGVTINYY